MIAQRVRARDSRSLAIQLGFFVALFAVWWFFTARHLVLPIFLPAPGAVASQLGAIFQSPTLPTDLFYTLGSFATAYVIGGVSGVLVGYVVSSRRFLTRVYEPMLASVYAVPLVVFFPTFILLFGTGPNSKIALGAVYAFFPIALNTIVGFGQVDRRFITAARSMGASNAQLLRRVLIPAALPVVATGLRIAFIACFASVLAGEMIASVHGIGYEIAQSGAFMNIATMFAYVMLVVLTALLFNLGLGAFEARQRQA